jgi:hypothetical protein
MEQGDYLLQPESSDVESPFDANLRTIKEELTTAKGLLSRAKALKEQHLEKRAALLTENFSESELDHVDGHIRIADKQIAQLEQAVTETEEDLLEALSERQQANKN